MQKHVAPTLSQRPLWLILLAAGLIVGTAMGIRQVMGLYLLPMTKELGIGREPFSDAMAVANIVWGVAAVPLGAISDRYGAGRVLMLGVLATICGLYSMYSARSGLDLMLSGILLGIGVGGTGVTALVGPVGRAAPDARRPQAIAAIGMAAGLGTFVAFPYVSFFMEAFSWKQSLAVLMLTLLALLPLIGVLAGRPATHGPVRAQSFSDAVNAAARLPSFWLLVAGFFVCGFHIAFFTVHLPAFVADKGLPPSVGVWALTSVGLTNILGTYLAGQSTRLVEKRIGLSVIYLLRSVAFLGLLFLPINGATVIAVSAILGLFWLSTVPLTSGLVATFFGPQWMSMLFGFVFLSHQLGSFAGLWLAGRIFDATKSYDLMWWISIALGIFAALVHWPIRERASPRLALAETA